MSNYTKISSSSDGLSIGTTSAIFKHLVTKYPAILESLNEL